MTLESVHFKTAVTTTTTTPPSTRDGRGPLTAQVHRPKGPEPMSRRPFKVGFQNIHQGIANANVIMEEGVRSVIGEPILLLEATLDAWVFGF